MSRETIGLPRALEELHNVKFIVHDHAALKIFFGSPSITFTEKKIFIDKVFVEDFFSTQLRHFLCFLIKKKRIALLTDIVDYVYTAYNHGTALDAVLRTTFPLDLEMLQDIKHQVEKKINRQTRLYVHLDPDLLGGVNVRVGNRLIDRSLKGALEELRERLLKVRI